MLVHLTREFAAFDAPVNVTHELGEKDGKIFFAVEGSNTGVPEDELDFDDKN